LNENLARALGSAAERGIREVAGECGVNLDDFDIVLSVFMYHPVDSRESLYYGAARSAFRAAWDAWQRYNAAPSYP